MRKTLAVLGLIADLSRPALLVLVGVGLIVGGATGTLWL